MSKTGANTKITGEPWFQCSVCGFDFPYAERMRHYKTGLLVDSRCDDLPTHHDYLSEWNPYDTEYERVSEQPVQNQGPQEGIGDLLVWNGSYMEVRDDRPLPAGDPTRYRAGPRGWRIARWKHGS
jgi:hypothetical protein